VCRRGARPGLAPPDALPEVPPPSRTPGPNRGPVLPPLEPGGFRTGAQDQSRRKSTPTGSTYCRVGSSKGLSGSNKAGAWPEVCAGREVRPGSLKPVVRVAPNRCRAGSWCGRRELPAGRLVSGCRSVSEPTGHFAQWQGRKISDGPPYVLGLVTGNRAPGPVYLVLAAHRWCAVYYPRA
jgi:hypothetical protein